jgi:hypothetical protein
MTLTHMLVDILLDLEQEMSKSTKAYDSNSFLIINCIQIGITTNTTAASLR